MWSDGAAASALFCIICRSPTLLGSTASKTGMKYICTDGMVELDARVSLRCAASQSGCCTLRWRCRRPRTGLAPAPPCEKIIMQSPGRVERSTTTRSTQPVYIQMRWNSHAVHHDGFVVAGNRFLLNWPRRLESVCEVNIGTIFTVLSARVAIGCWYSVMWTFGLFYLSSTLSYDSHSCDIKTYRCNVVQHVIACKLWCL